MPRVARPKDSEMTQKLHQLGILIRLHRMRKQLSPNELSQLAGISVYRITRYEAGQIDPPFSALCQIAKALGMDVADLLKHESFKV
jgi:transcriptional regulator with XRE-family HTH domain